MQVLCQLLRERAMSLPPPLSNSPSPSGTEKENGGRGAGFPLGLRIILCESSLVQSRSDPVQSVCVCVRACLCVCFSFPAFVSIQVGSQVGLTWLFKDSGSESLSVESRNRTSPPSCPLPHSLLVSPKGGKAFPPQSWSRGRSHVLVVGGTKGCSKSLASLPPHSARSLLTPSHYFPFFFDDFSIHFFLVLHGSDLGIPRSC
ncbi:hypothetical protein IE53DRAFT_225115 [Violaceomyces palustris]|uniref:Uncharacterized protein n=1 Tax=Violaceomyces palustris TaxID=1673888 RepID=A0ACD0NQ75_9BASI|nr:hypothetical protein IE53DRAFT_225115 [Violaceomyces palustris]